MAKGIFSFFLVFFFVFLLLALSSLEFSLTESFIKVKSIALKAEKSYYLRSELELNSDAIIEDVLSEALNARKAVKNVSEFASSFPGLNILSFVSNDNNTIDEAAHLAIAFLLADYFQEIEKSGLVKFYFGELNAEEIISQGFLEENVKKFDWLDLWQNSFTLIDVEKNTASFIFTGSKNSREVVFAVISLQNLRQIFVIPSGYLVEVKY